MDDENRLASKYIALQIDDEAQKILSNYPEVTPTYSDSEYKAVEARSIKNAALTGGESTTYNIKLWMDESVTIDDDAMNKIFASKISVVVSSGEYPLLATTIANLAESDTENLVADDETDDHNIRYIGADPDNYLCFDKTCANGKWRVIGIMNNMGTESNGTQSLVKIIRAESVGKYAWDNSTKFGTNNWAIATLQTNLNSGDLYTTYIEKYNSLFETVIWYLGGLNADEYETATPSRYYELERGDSVYTGNPTTWSGKLGLMYPSDYGYAISGGSTTDRTACLAKSMRYWDEVSDCYNSDFLYLKSTEWTLTQHFGYASWLFAVNKSMKVLGFNASVSLAARPVGYLVSSTVILSGNGSNETPWIVGA